MNLRLLIGLTLPNSSRHHQQHKIGISQDAHLRLSQFNRESPFRIYASAASVDQQEPLALAAALIEG